MYDQRAPAFRKDYITFACRLLPAEHESIHAGLPPPCHERPRKDGLDLSDSSDALPCQWHPTVSRPDPVAPDNATRSVSLQECHPRPGPSPISPDTKSDGEKSAPRIHSCALCNKGPPMERSPLSEASIPTASSAIWKGSLPLARSSGKRRFNPRRLQENDRITSVARHMPRRFRYVREKEGHIGGVQCRLADRHNRDLSQYSTLSE